MKDQRLLELAISGLEAQRDRIEDELDQLRGRLKGTGKATPSPAPAKKSGRKVRSAAQKKAHSERMKKIWADRKKATK